MPSHPLLCQITLKVAYTHASQRTMLWFNPVEATHEQTAMASITWAVTPGPATHASSHTACRC
jgi:hypothetical protein